MIFRVCEHYYYDDEQYNECFICFEYITDNENKPINLQKQQLYVNNCCCDVAVHTCCLHLFSFQTPIKKVIKI